MTLEIGLLTAILVLVVLSLFARAGGKPAPALRSLERKLDLILTSLGIEPNQGLDKQLSELVQSGRKIEAIKLYRQQSGVGLKEAKDYVDGL